jgi:hypothetical protein
VLTRFQNKPNLSTAASRSRLLGNIIFLATNSTSYFFPVMFNWLLFFFLQLCVLFLYYILMTLLNQQFSPLRNVEETPYTKVHWTHNHMHDPNWLPNPNWGLYSSGPQFRKSQAMQKGSTISSKTLFLFCLLWEYDYAGPSPKSS